ncbi:MAG: type I DNA topoisomerase [Bacteroidota bacterium]
MAKNLVIVESPAKAKTIEGFLGPDFLVKSSFGHVRDLVKKGLGVDTDNKFEPTYEVSPDKTKVVSELKSLAKKAEMVWLASDEDREGEAISWHLFETLDLKKNNTKRIVFHEITKPAILKAIQNPREIDKNLVDAQQARRILDRLVGFELSPILWKKVRPSLSAGRVQSVSVRLIVEREREIQNFVSVYAFKVSALFQNSKGQGFKAELPNRFAKKEQAFAFLEKCSASNFKIENLEVKPAKKTPSAPFTTSTLQQEASRKLGFSVAQTMALAQRLYESGKITYMRTDSVNLSETAIDAAKAEITRTFGKEFHFARQYKNKSKGAQEAHEAIRPTYMENRSVNGEPREQKLYDLIWKRTLASQMADAQLEKTTATISISKATEKFIAQGEVLKFEGFLKVYIESTDDEDSEEQEGMLPPLTLNEDLKANEINAVQRFTHHPARYTEASLVKKLEELGIGRPSTYAPTISTIQNRGYVIKDERDGVKRNFEVLTLKNNKIAEETKSENTGAEKSKLFPTDIGIVVNDFLMQHFSDVLDFNFTATVEKEFDDIAEGKLVWNKMIAEFYKPFHKDVEKTTETSERASGEKNLGIDPASGKQIIVRIGRFGPIAQIGEAGDDDDKPRFASLRKNQSIETITLDEALDLFKLPANIGEYNGQELVVAIGRFGPYIKYGEQFVSIPKTIEPLEVDLKKAIELIQEKETAEAPFAQYKGKPVTKGKGRFGPFIKYEGIFINVPRAYNFDNLSQKDINELIDKKLEKEANRFIAQWNDEKITIENGRWGPFIRFGKNMLKLIKKEGGKFTSEEAAELSLDEVKKMIEIQMPDAFTKKAKTTKAPIAIGAAKKGTAVKKASTASGTKKKATTKTTTTKKAKK